MKDMLYAVVALISVIAAGFFFYNYVSPADAESANALYFVLALLFLVITLVCGALFLSGRVNKTEDIHITE